MKKKIKQVAVLDVGTSKTVCIIANILSHGSFEIIGTGYCSSQGIRAGVITDIQSLAESIKEAITIAEESASTTIRTVTIALPPAILISQQSSAYLNISGKEITEKDLHKMIISSVEFHTKPAEQIIHTFLHSYKVDGENVDSPLGLYGDKCECSINIISAKVNSLLAYRNSLNRYTKIEISQYISSNYALALATLQPNEEKNGVILIDFGAGSSNLTLVKNGSIIYTDSINLGGNSIANDLAICFGINLEEAEKIKNLYGSVFSGENDIKEKIPLNIEDHQELGNMQKFVSREEIISIIRARVEEIFEILLERAINSESKNAIFNTKRIILAGGCARMEGLSEFISEIFGGCPVRIGNPEFISSLDPTFNLEMAVSIGMLIHIFDQDNLYFDNGQINVEGGEEGEIKKNILDKIWQAIKNFFTT